MRSAWARLIIADSEKTAAKAK